MHLANLSSLAVIVGLLPLTYALVLPYQNERPLMMPNSAVGEHEAKGNDDVGFATTAYRIPTVHESAVQARRILQLASIGTLSTVFPSSSSSLLEASKAAEEGEGEREDDVHESENRPSGLGGMPIGLMEYFAACEEELHPGDPTMLEITIATSFKNVRSGSNITMSLRWRPPQQPYSVDPNTAAVAANELDALAVRYSQANLPRFAMVGYIEHLTAADVRSQGVGDCFARKHPDARLWFPGNQIHESKWARLVVQQLYWIGGFGDQAYIGWIPLADWQSVTQKEIDAVRLPGEVVK